MNKVCVIVETPAINREDDMLLPDYLSIELLQKLIADAVKDLSDGAFEPKMVFANGRLRPLFERENFFSSCNDGRERV